MSGKSAAERIVAGDDERDVDVGAAVLSRRPEAAVSRPVRNIKELYDGLYDRH
jgi:hypothetical protein